MNKKCRGILYFFIFVTLFFMIQSSIVFAKSPSELIDGHKVLRYVHSSDGVVLYSYEVIKLPFKKEDVQFDEYSGAMMLSENDYLSFKIKYKTPDGNELVQEPIIGINNDNGDVFLRLSKEIPVGSTYRLSVIESIEGKDEDGKSTINEKITSTSEKIFEIDEDNLGIAEFERTTWLSAGWAALQGDLSKIGKILVETFCDIITPAGDAFLDMICNSMGEAVTIDSVVYNRVNKLDIDFFDKSSGVASGDTEVGTAELSTSLKSIMKKVVDKLYVFFRNIVVVFYLIILVYIGVNILMTTTAERKSDYKAMFMSWVIGVIMLMFFPYVMKYTIKLNSSLCKMIGEEIGQKESYTASQQVKELTISSYGKDEFVTHMATLYGESPNDNAMLNVRVIGKNSSNIPLLIVYFIFIGQLLAILILYYKRVFMIAFLISIFPIVAAIYPLCRIGAINMNPFGVWFKEFVVNVFVQSFHAATYKVIVTIGVASYLNGGNWLFLIMSVLFLFEGEKLIRAIFSAKSNANTIGDMAMAGAIAMNMMKNVGSVIPTIEGKNKEQKGDDELAKDKAKKDVSSKSNRGAESNKRAVENISSGSNTSTENSTLNMDGTTTTDIDIQANSSGTKNNLTNNTNVKATGVNSVDTKIDDLKTEKKMGKGRKIAASVVGTGFSIGTQVTGGVIGTTYGLAQNNAKQGFNAAVSGFASGVGVGKAIGKSGKAFLNNRIEKSSDKKAALITAARYEAGEFDDDIGINEADRQLNDERAKAIRKAYAEYARRSRGWRGKTGAQLKFYKEQMKILNESVERNKD